MVSRFLFLVAAFLHATVSTPQRGEPEGTPKVSLSAEEFNHLLAYQGTNFGGFYPRQGLRQYVDELDEDYDGDLEDDDEDEDDEDEALGTPSTTPATREKPTRTRGYAKAVGNKPYSKPFPHRKLFGRQAPPTDEFTYSCPTDVQCDNGGCCPLGDYCAIKNGQLGCCPIGSLCDASPIPGCGTSCYGICCDAIQTLIGQRICSPTPGPQGEASGVCMGVEPTSPLYTPPSNNCDLSVDFACGDECCPSNAGLECDNATIPGEPFCNIPANICPRGILNPRDCYNVTTDTAAFVTTRVPYSSSRISASVSYTTTALGVTIQAATNGSTATSAGSTGSSSAGTATSTVAAKSSSGAMRAVRGSQEGVRWGECLGSLGGVIVLAMGIGAVLL